MNIMAKSKSPSKSDNKLGGFINLVVLTMVMAIIIGMLLPLMDTLGLEPLREAAPQISQVVDAIPLIVGLGFIISVVFAFIKLIKPE